MRNSQSACCSATCTERRGAAQPSHGVVVTDLRTLIGAIPDFPTPGILFRDLLPLLAQPDAHREVIRQFVEFARPLKPDVVIGAEARGFLFGPTLAHALGCAFAPARKAGKLPVETWTASYSLEYGADTLEISRAAIAPGARVLVHDDVLATGGTAAASLLLVHQAQAVTVGACFVAELVDLHGRARLGAVPVTSLVEY